MYPRASGHCFSHHIPSTVVSLKDSPLISEHELSKALIYLREIRVDLVKGDLVLFDSNIGYRNEGVAIFNGDKIVELSDDVDDYGSVPQELRVIEDGVPINYWAYLDDTDIGRGITHNSIVWFNHMLVQDQCLRNITYTTVGKSKSTFLTWFNYSGQQYHIIYCYADADSIYDDLDDDYAFKSNDSYIKVSNKFYELFRTPKLFPFEWESEFYPDLNNGRTLFVRMN